MGLNQHLTHPHTQVDAVTGGIQYFIYDPDFNRIECTCCVCVFGLLHMRVPHSSTPTTVGTCAPPVGKITCAEPEQA